MDGLGGVCASLLLLAHPRRHRDFEGHLFNRIIAPISSIVSASLSPRILLLVTDLNIGGTPTVIRELAVRLKPFAEIQVACLSHRGPVSDQIESNGIQTTALGASSARDVRVIHRLHRLISREHIDIVFSFLIHANAAAAAVSLFSKNFRLLESIQTTQPNPSWHWRVQKYAQRAAEKIVVPSPSVAKVAKEWSGVPESKIVIIPNAIDPHEFASIPNPADENDFPVGFLGRLDPIKRIPDLIEAVQRISRVHLHIFGDGPERAKIQSMIDDPGLTRRVTLHGAVHRPQDALCKMRMLVLPSAAEGFGLVLIEAMAAGIPIVATDVPGICDVMKSEQTALLVPVSNPQKLADAIQRLISDPLLRHRLIDAAKLDVQNRFTWDIVLPQYRKLLGV
jgi:glycosyltransferase involved in cell wall biosynthesis